jgi:hypothetical protein
MKINQQNVHTCSLYIYIISNVQVWAFSLFSVVSHISASYVEISSIHSSDPLNVRSSFRPLLIQYRRLNLLSDFPEIRDKNSLEKLSKVQLAKWA